jgi:hypothetical protein
MTTTVIGLFKDIREVDGAIKALKNQGFDLSQISLKAGPEVVNVDIEADAAKREMAAGITNGAITGAALGLLVGTIWGLSSIPLPGTNPGVTVEALQTLLTFVVAGIAVGAIAGSFLLASLVKLGLSTESHFYINGLKQKGVLITVQTPEEKVPEVQTVLHEANAVEGSVS